MLVYLLKIFMSLITGYLFIMWCPVIELLSFSDIIVKLVLNPIQFFASSIAFMAGVLVNADLIKKEFLLLAHFFQGEYSFEVLAIPLHIAGLCFLSTIGIWQTLLFLCLALFYGMISVDFSKSRRAPW
ncbi:hypothetical protein FZC78_05590 [Rossellomorea vietnamensis]|uniref:Uncharacterized protein n=1 Tax=Rossellomorea vietnamensis TaxID=218284 RepID=A0A5D4NXF2_9BACI|nr:hypothetical protein [Rossellomorea vietnamensis]TYS18967.1 hypothetical protein FZC78_05590 [Rossellomorea vietnamensis]